MVVVSSAQLSTGGAKRALTVTVGGEPEAGEGSQDVERTWFLARFK